LEIVAKHRTLVLFPNLVLSLLSQPWLRNSPISYKYEMETGLHKTPLVVSEPWFH
jgi:hypothetical protein